MRTAAGHALLVLFGLAAWLLLYALATAPAWAHAIGAGAGGWGDGFAHPFTGIDHFLCIVAIGVWAAQVGGGAVWMLPASFTLVMALGAALGLAGIVLPGAEDAVAVSVAVLGVLLAVTARPRPVAAVAVVAGFGLAHGYAHGAEMPATAEPALYAVGFVLASLLLQLAGLAVGLLAQSRLGGRLLPYGAAAVAGIGVSLVLAL